MNEKIIVNNNKRNNIPTILKGITPEQIKSINQRQGKTFSYPKAVQNMASHKKRPKTPGIAPPPPVRPNQKYLTSLLEDPILIDLPELGSFNAGIVSFPGRDEYIMVYRPDEYSFIACILNKEFEVKKNSYFKFSITNCADPRIIWTPDKKLLMIYSSTDEVGLRYECIRGAIIMDLAISDEFINAKPFRVSPKELTDRQKNWTPFVYKNKIYLVASICPHVIYELILLDNNDVHCEKRFETEWLNPWFYQEFLRGNTNPVLMADGNFLGTFHTAVKLGKSMHYYDNGCYVFEGKPPFRVLKCANQTYLPAEAATERHFRKRELIKVDFPVGMIIEGERLLISYGDNDSIVKIMETTVEKMLALTVDVY